MTPEASQQLELVDCSEILCRFALKKRFLEPESADAFVLRPSDKGRLSVFCLSRVSLSDASQIFKEIPPGSFSLHAGHVRNIAETGIPRLEVVIEESLSDPCPGHAAILNLPDPQLEFEVAQRAASLLKRVSRRLS